MKFQNPSMDSSKVMLCIKIHDYWTDNRITDELTDKLKQYALRTSLKLGA